MLELELDRGQHLRGDQFGEFALPEQAPQQVAIEGQGGGPALGDRGVGLVEKGSHEGEEQRRGERRGPLGLDLDDSGAPCPDVGQDLFQGGQVEVVGQHLAVRLEDYREGPVLTGHAEQVGGPATLEPERGAAPRPPAGEQQSPTRRLPESGCEQRRVGQVLLDELSGFLGVEGEVGQTGGLVAIGEPEGDAVVGPDDVDVAPKPAAQLVGEGHGPRGMDPGAERREQDDPPVSDLVAEPFDHQGLVGREDPGRFSLLAQIGRRGCGPPDHRGGSRRRGRQWQLRARGRRSP